MRRTGFLILMMVLLGIWAQAQPGGRRMERIHAIKVAYLTDKLQLTSEQSARFWPVYNQYEEEKMGLMRSMRKNNSVNDNTSEDPMRSIDDDIAIQEKMLDLRKKYKDEFLKVISPQQLVTLIESEKEFKRLLLQQMKERRGGMDNRRGGGFMR
jgi:hypothetical protein